MPVTCVLPVLPLPTATTIDLTDLSTVTGVLMVADLDYILSLNIGFGPGWACRLVKVPFAPGPCLATWVSATSNGWCRFVVGPSGQVVVGCPSYMASLDDYDAYAAWLIDTDHWRDASSSGFALIDPPADELVLDSVA